MLDSPARVSRPPHEPTRTNRSAPIERSLPRPQSATKASDQVPHLLKADVLPRPQSSPAPLRPGLR